MILTMKLLYTLCYELYFHNTVNEPDELCASMYSFHSSPEEKNKLLFALAQHGIETTVDRAAKKKRIRDWIQESVIQEDEEESEDSPVATTSAMISRAPVVGHVSSVRAAEKAERVAARAAKNITTTIKDATKKHRDPRTGEIQQGPSEMGAHGVQNDQSQTNGQQMTHYKLVDVGSQTSSESQKMADGVADECSNDVSQSTSPRNPRLSANHRQFSAPEPLATSRGLMTAFNSVATITLPEASIQTASDQINDSGYGSLDKLKATEHQNYGGTGLASPILSRRHDEQQQHVNGRHDRRREKDHSPFESDSGGDGSPYGSSMAMSYGESNGTININRGTMISTTMKDSPYDFIKPRRNKLK